jgi:predicted metal-binding protein
MGGRGDPQPSGEQGHALLLVGLFAPFGPERLGMAAVLYVCMTCKAGQPVPEGAAPPGANLFAALNAAAAPAQVEIRPVECLSACDHGCNVALSQPGGWSYVYGRLGPDDVPEILRGAAAYAATTDGIVPWRERPVIFRKQSIARFPPQFAASEPVK